MALQLTPQCPSYFSCDQADSTYHSTYGAAEHTMDMRSLQHHGSARNKGCGAYDLEHDDGE